MKKYNLNFYEALKEVLENGASVKGENFKKGYFLKLGKFSLVLVDANQLYTEEPFDLYKGIELQKFRELTVMTMKELSE